MYVLHRKYIDQDACLPDRSGCMGKKHVIHENLLKKEKNLSFSQAKDFWSTLLPLINIKLCHGFKGSDN